MKQAKNNAKGVQRLGGEAADSVGAARRGGSEAAPSGHEKQGFTTVEQQGNSSPPLNNMGENVAETVEEQQVLKGRRILTTLAKKTARENLAIIDWVNFTVHETTFVRTAGCTLIDSDHYVIEASKQLQKIFGFGVTEKRDRGMNHYLESWVLGENFGFVCFGKQRETMLITLSGTGCQNAAQGWQKRLFQFLSNVAVRPNISRIDLAHDDIEGRYLSVDWAVEQWRQRGFNSAKGGRLCNIERVGNWDMPTGAGRTVTFGTREAGKFCRFYEKGRQLGNKLSEWCRAEVEFKSSDRIIPLEILLEPSCYFAGAYPCFAQFMHEENPKTLELKKRAAEITVEAAIRIVKHQYGKYNTIFRQLFGDADYLNSVQSDNKDDVPKRLQSVMDGLGKTKQYIHENYVVPVADFIYVHGQRVERGAMKKHIKAERNFYGDYDWLKSGTA